MESKALTGKTALITGASRGLGKAIAIALAKAGARVILTARDLDLLNQAAGAIREFGGQSLVYKTDVTDEAQILKLLESVSRESGKIQILVNNAGMNIRKAATEFTLAEWRQVVD